ncbi:MAG: polyprenyl synthetase family protein [Armatimonadetes bacterium]|nr:polyprenyl synthetase family protein [Armatimonadota bacterium]MCX7967295.1 polyprenyl synthetase family protein [Armatimonadota bacterium]MDW8143309.1 polyprenyl synthetase family protein [Armatimonadota bacterium]
MKVVTEFAELMSRLEECRRKVDEALDKWMPREDEIPSVLHKAMRYSVFAGGKRLRPFLVLESCKVVGGDEEKALPAACAVEVLHTYTLVHDDLPSMDNDDFRRGKPTCHKVFGEGMAILCGDALQNLAFELLATKLPEQGVSAEVALKCIAALAQATGSRWLIGGQALDITEQAKGYSDRSPEKVSLIHERKTAALMQACCVIGGLIGDANEEQLNALKNFGYWLGLAFQITDDILDEIGDPEKLGKSVGKDKQQKKLTYTMVFGLEKSRQMADEAVKKAVEALSIFGNEAKMLRILAQFILERQS